MADTKEITEKAELAAEPVQGLIAKAKEAASRQEWQSAHDLFVEADARAPLDAESLAILADAAYATGKVDLTIGSWERAYQLNLQAGATLDAAGAAVRVAMHLLLDTALMGPVRGWLKRAQQLLEGQAEGPVHAWFAVIQNYERLLSGDFPAARLWARRAIDVGAEFAPAAAAIGRVAEARSLILEGDGLGGQALLNEAGVAALSGELDPISTGVVYCELVCAMQGLAQYDLAEQWTEAMERWHLGQPVGSIHGRCRVHKAEILRLRGSNREAEAEIIHALEELQPYLKRELGWPLTELGRIRMRLGDVRGAEDAFLAGHAAGWESQPGLALVYLAQGRIGAASAAIREALDHPSTIPSKELPPNTDLRRVPLLEAQAEIEIAAGNNHGARNAALELKRIVQAFGSKALDATAALAMGRVLGAEGDLKQARMCMEEAIRGWQDVGAPYEEAVARLDLARVYLTEGSEQRASMEFRAAGISFEQLGAIHLTAAASHDSRGADQSERSAIPLSLPNLPEALDYTFRHEGDHWLLAFDGTSARLRDQKGLHYLARLLENPDEEFHVLALVAGESGEPWTGVPLRGALEGMDAGTFLDAEAKESYRRRLVEIDEDIEEARAMADDERVFQAQREREFLVREISRAVGLGGRDRRAASTSERARASVTKAIRQAMVKIQDYHPALGAHLTRAIRTGTYCSYLPDSRVGAVWKT